MSSRLAVCAHQRGEPSLHDNGRGAGRMIHNGWSSQGMCVSGVDNALVCMQFRTSNGELKRESLSEHVSPGGLLQVCYFMYTIRTFQRGVIKDEGTKGKSF